MPLSSLYACLNVIYYMIGIKHSWSYIVKSFENITAVKFSLIAKLVIL